MLPACYLKFPYQDEVLDNHLDYQPTLTDLRSYSSRLDKHFKARLRREPTILESNPFSIHQLKFELNQ